MNSQKKEVILNEISFWKKNKLLPEHYCDFLTTLYSEGQEVEENNTTKIRINAANSLLAENYSKNNLKTILASIAIILIFVALFVLKAPFVLIPIILSVSIIVGLLVFLFKFKPNKTVRKTLTYATIALLIFGVSIKIVNLYFGGHPSLLYGVLLGNCILWLLTGRLLNLIYFKISGIIGLIIVIFYMLFK
ncbi:hypothetical protein CW357_10740 [Rummeliibacillus sp. TYF005]|uniref:hypothetical protein n=1 Tax=unclassified Rummeliibacillus TaxID=2622809 RepID=UPI000E66938D|nr:MULTISPECIES: hypothetical protein [unclassified Rummeliibacillus]RIJ67597.1 hypothetical protein D1606_04645 [Rummeliibacillus sp. POC4]RPJ95351.1 hypothetical protein CW357_10740 [Rummeliibacillus sp. TYF005]